MPTPNANNNESEKNRTPEQIDALIKEGTRIWNQIKRSAEIVSENVGIQIDVEENDIVTMQIWDIEYDISDEFKYFTSKLDAGIPAKNAHPPRQLTIEFAYTDDKLELAERMWAEVNKQTEGMHVDHATSMVKYVEKPKGDK